MGQTISSYFTTQEEYEALGTVLQGNGEFTKKLYSILSRNTGNVFFSPVIIHAILSLVYQGARGETEQVLTKTLNVPDATVAAKGYKVLMSRLTSMKNVTLLMANKILLQNNVLEQNFKKVAVKQFLAEVDRVDFSQPASVTASVNSWVEKKTKNKIKDLITPDDIQNDTNLILVNAIYFKGKWAIPFKTTNTRTQMFYINDHDTINVQMMHVEKDCFYKRDDTLGSQILELPYINKDVSLIVILPNERNGIAALEKKLAAVDLTRITENMFKSKVKVDLPKFKIEQTIDLNGPLTELGLGVMFGDDADFSGVTKSLHLRVEKVLQKSCIEVSEEGTEAAAADAADVMMLCVTPSFTADHPFFIMLRSNHGNTSNILFAGRISNPQY